MTRALAAPPNRARAEAIASRAVTRIPKPYRFPLLLFVGVLVFVGFGHPASALPVIVLIGGVIALMIGFERWGRRRARARRAAMPYGTGVWRGRFGGTEIFALADVSLWRAWMFDVVTYDVVVTPELLSLRPTAGARRIGGFPQIDLGWERVVRAVARPGVRELVGKPSVVPLTPVTLLLVGDDIDVMYRPVTDEEAEAEQIGPQERAEMNAETMDFARERFGDDFVVGTYPFTVFFPDAEGLVDTVARYARGVIPS